MDSTRRTSFIAGVLFIITFVRSEEHTSELQSHA